MENKKNDKKKIKKYRENIKLFNFIKTFNLTLKALNILSDELSNQHIRLITKLLIDLGYAQEKVQKNKALKILYEIKEKLIKQVENNNKNNIKSSSNFVKIQNKYWNEKIFQNKILTIWNKNIKIHIPKEKENINTIKEVPKETVINKIKYKNQSSKDFLRKFIDLKTLDKTLTEVKNILNN